MLKFGEMGLNIPQTVNSICKVLKITPEPQNLELILAQFPDGELVRYKVISILETLVNIDDIPF